MVALDIDWLKLHNAMYKRMRLDLEASPPRPPAREYIREQLPKFFSRTMNLSEVFIANEAGTKIIDRRIATEGEPCLFWNGDAVETRPFNEQAIWMHDFFAMGQRLLDIAAALGIASPTVIDLGSGPGTQSFALRAMGCAFKAINLDAFDHVLTVGATIARPHACGYRISRRRLERPACCGTRE